VVQWLEVQPEDDEKTRTKKRKLAKSYKSKIRFQKMDAQQRDKQSSWLDFQKGKGTKKKAGFFTGLLFVMRAHAAAHAPHATMDILAVRLHDSHAQCHAAGKKKGSMFSVPEGVNAKVGVIGSGQTPTDYKAKSRHDFAATDDAA